MSIAELQAKVKEQQNEERRRQRELKLSSSVGSPGRTSSPAVSSKPLPSFRDNVRKDGSPVQVRLSCTIHFSEI